MGKTLEQEFVKVPSESLREAVLLSTVSRNYKKRAIVFCGTKHAAHRLAIIFGLCGLSFAELHGNLQQSQRVLSLKAFQEEEADFLLATDLASRGLDLTNVETVINFHLPLNTARYIHRVGRTARMGNVGRAVTLYVPEEYSKVKRLGKQVCTKVESKVLKRSVAADAVREWSQKVEGLTADIEAVVAEESVDREMRLADMLVERQSNMEKHKAAILSRPEKKWFQTAGERQELKEASNELAKPTENGEEEPPEPTKTITKKKKKGTFDPDETAEQRRKRRAKEKHQRKKEEATKEKEASERKVRAIARRVRRNSVVNQGTPEDGEGQGKPKKKGKRR